PEYGQVALRVEAGGIPRMGEDREETEVPRWRPHERPDETPAGHLRQHGTERVRADGRPDRAKRELELASQGSRRAENLFRLPLPYPGCAPQSPSCPRLPQRL